MSHSISLPQLPLPPGDSFHDRLPGRQLHAEESISTLQVNLGLYCNLACKHCHVASSPKRTTAAENMSAETADKLIEWLNSNRYITTIDLTGGSPEANPQFRRLVSEASRLGLSIIDRCNPTIIEFADSHGTNFRWLPQFLAEHRVHVVASLPCYLEDNVRKQRGIGAYDASIAGLLALNSVGYGTHPDLLLTLVYNPVGPHLPPNASKLESDYRSHLKERFGISFSQLWTITNMPISRWKEDLQRNDQLADYMKLLTDSFNPKSVDKLMCRHQIHIDCQGQVYDCDFNYALRMTSPAAAGKMLWDLAPTDLNSREIATGDHCFGCTAGCGSSCGGSLTDAVV